jgi:hypothetical protein
LRKGPHSGGIIEDENEICELEADLAAEASAPSADC